MIPETGFHWAKRKTNALFDVAQNHPNYGTNDKVQILILRGDLYQSIFKTS
jgi:hypothetical protein